MRTRETQIPGVTGSIRVLIPCPLLPDGIRVSKYRSPCCKQRNPVGPKRPHLFFFFLFVSLLPHPKFFFFCGNSGYWADSWRKFRTSESSFFRWREKAEISRPWFWIQPGISGSNRTHLFFVFLRASVPPWCKGLVFGCGFVAP